MTITLNNRKHAAGFTLFEIIMVLVIIAGLMAVIIPKVVGQADQAKQREAKVKMSEVKTALALYKLEVGKLPENLQALITAPSGAKGWNGPYLTDPAAAKDPWGNEYRYTLQGGKFTLVSMGADGKDGGAGLDADLNENG